MKRFFKNPMSFLNKRGLIIGVACALVCGLLNKTDSMRRLENSALDACFQLRGARTSQSNIVIVVIDDAMLEQLGKPFVQISPELAQVTNHLSELGAQVVGIDLLIPQSVESMQELRAGEVGDADSMARVVAETDKIVLSEYIGSGGAIEGPLGQWKRSIDFQGNDISEWNDVGYVNLTVDSDMNVRRQLLRARVGELLHPSFSLAVFSKAKELERLWINQPALEIGNRTIPLQSERLLVNFIGPPGTIPRIPFSEVLEASRTDKSLDVEVEDAVVLIGAEFESQQDAHAMPYSGLSNALTFLPTSWLGYSPALMPGVEVHANILATLSDEAFIITPWFLKTPMLLLVCGILLGSALSQLNLESGALIVVVHHFAWKIICCFAFYVASWRIEVMAMLLLVPVVYGSVFALRWRLVRRMMGLFKSEAIARAMELNPGQLDLKGESRVVTVLFSDIRGFTSFSEVNEPRSVVKLLNEYFTAVVPVIESHGGVINQYMGDGVMVIFGAPVDQPDHACRAVAAGLDVLKKVDSLHNHWCSLGMESLRIGIGIHTGLAITGTVGSPRRLDYTAIGDTVNTASRIESATKDVGVELLISEQTLETILPNKLAELGVIPAPHTVSVKGKQENLTVYSLQKAETSKSGNVD